MLTEIIGIAIGELIVKQNSLSHFGNRPELLKGFRINPPREGRGSTRHAFVQVEKQGAVSLRLMLTVLIRVSKVVMGRVFLSNVVMDQLQGLTNSVAVLQIRSLFLVTSSKERFINV